MPNAYIGKGATIGKNSIVMSGAYIGDYAKIGENTVIYPSAVVYRDCHVGNNCIIHAGAVIGSDGFGFAHTKTGEHVKIYQNGIAIIEDDVEIGANTTIYSAVFGVPSLHPCDTEYVSVYRGKHH
jgi:UDP-3-O-[3-hydroxymyristoyl] glucosamine N-acyltransferase